MRDPATAPNWEIYNLDDRGEKTTLISSGQYDPRVRPWYKAAIEAKEIVCKLAYKEFNKSDIPGYLSQKLESN